MSYTDIVFLDTETLGLDRAAPIWDFAAWRYRADGADGYAFRIQHSPNEHWIAELPENFRADYFARRDLGPVLNPREAAELIHEATRGAIVHGSNPSFDLERLESLLLRYGITPQWHYHPIDIPSLVQGYLAARGQLPARPWTSESLSAALGVDPASFQRHTALGDVSWTVAQYRAIFSGAEAR